MKNSITFSKNMLVGIALAILPTANFANTMDLADVPLYLSQTVPPITMIVMGRDHHLYYEAYNDASDLNNDGVIDTHYKPDTITYFGYFDSYKCYAYSNGEFIPTSETSTKKCSGSWSGDFLNYITTSRIDALRKVLYGGTRYTDSEDTTVLQRSYIPQDAHSWGKEYTSVAVDGYSISDYTPLSLPSSGNRHLFANTTLLGSSSGEPLMRVAPNQPYRVWDWLSIERPVAGSKVLHGGSGPSIASSITDYKVRVRVCVPTLLEENCQVYPNGYFKPVGLLQEYGENDSMKFGLLTGSYGKNLSGGVLRKNIESMQDEINSNTGQILSSNGIINTIDRLRVIGFGSSYYYPYSCGWITSRNINDGECREWGNPIAEMMYEATRYFAGKTTPTSDFDYSGGDDATLGLPKPSWESPYANNKNPWCSKPNMLVISNILTSHDTDKVPGSAFSSFSGDLSPALDASALGQTIWNTEKGGSSSHFVGQVGTNNDGTPSAKLASSFGNIRGFSPIEPNKEGGYYSASVAHYGWLNDVNSTTKDDQNIHTFVLALAPPLPDVKVNVNGNIVRIIPFAKSVGGCIYIDSTKGQFQPTNTIVDYYIESLTPTSGVFRINFEDVQQGADHDMDAIARYEYSVINGQLQIKVDSIYAAGCIQQHLGYVLSGTTADGTYLVVRDSDTSESSDTDYFLDTPPGEPPYNTNDPVQANNWQDGVALPLTSTRLFTASSTPAATILEAPLWYAAKWGGFTDKNGNNIPDQASEFDADNDGLPDNYFLVNNAGTLKKKLAAALNEILNRTSSASSVALNSGSLSTDSRLYQALFTTTDWTGQLLAVAIDPVTGAIDLSGSGPFGSQWDAGALLENNHWDTGRNIITYNTTTKLGIPFRFDSLSDSQKLQMQTNPVTGLTDTPTLGQSYLNYIRGDRTNEIDNGGVFRDRKSLLGDIINSAPLFVGVPVFPYDEKWPTGAPENNSSYAAYKNSLASRAKMVYVGANDGMLHAFNADTGAEVFSYIPSSLIQNLSQLTSAAYTHKFYVDSSANAIDAFYNNAWHTVLVGGMGKGGQGIYALNVTNPGTVTETGAENLVMWEFTDADDADLGYTFSQPAVVRLASGKWAVVFGNGYNNTVLDSNASTTGNAVLFIVDLETGALIKKLDTGVGASADPTSTGRPNGLSTPVVVDSNGDYIADYIYVGDLFGNLWKININDSDPAQWDFAYTSSNNPAPLFVAQDSAGNRQMITSRPNIGRFRGKNPGLQIYFGTGKYLETADKTDMSIQTFYSLRDLHTSTPIASRSTLLEQTIKEEVSYTHPDGSTSDLRITSDNQIADTHDGWYIDLVLGTTVQGERQITNSILRNGKVIFTTLIPSTDPCDYGGSGWLMELSAHDGSRLSYSPFDIDQDGEFTEKDFVNHIGDSGGSEKVPASGIKSTVGLIPSPSIIDNGNVEYKYISGTSGGIQQITENPGLKLNGRQSWRQLK